MKEYGFFLCLLIKAFVIPLHFDFSTEISYLLPATPDFGCTNNATQGIRATHRRSVAFYACAKGSNPCLVCYEPYDALYHSLRGISKMIAGIHLKHSFYTQRLVVIKQSSGVLLNCRHNLVARPRFLVTERQI